MDVRVGGPYSALWHAIISFHNKCCIAKCKEIAAGKQQCLREPHDFILQIRLPSNKQA